MKVAIDIADILKKMQKTHWLMIPINAANAASAANLMRG